MKFSKLKKAKMRKIRQKQINRQCKYMIGHTIDYEHGYKAKDQAKINNIMYLLVNSEEENQFWIYRIVRPYEYARIMPKRVLKMKEEFSNCANWYNHNAIEITDEGNIKSVRRTRKETTIKNGKVFHEYIVL